MHVACTHISQSFFSLSQLSFSSLGDTAEPKGKVTKMYKVGRVHFYYMENSSQVNRMHFFQIEQLDMPFFIGRSWMWKLLTHFSVCNSKKILIGQATIRTHLYAQSKQHYTPSKCGQARFHPRSGIERKLTSHFIGHYLQERERQSQKFLLSPLK